MKKRKGKNIGMGLDRLADSAESLFTAILGGSVEADGFLGGILSVGYSFWRANLLSRIRSVDPVSAMGDGALAGRGSRTAASQAH